VTNMQRLLRRAKKWNEYLRRGGEAAEIAHIVLSRIEDEIDMERQIQRAKGKAA